MNELTQDTQKKLESLKDWFRKSKGSVVAFSGGIDSSLVLYMARMVQGKENAIGVISNSESLKNKDFELALNFCKTYDINLEVIHTEELKDVRYNANPFNRCFYCKEHLYQDLESVKGKYPGFLILNGTNADDHSDYRPGLKAAADYNVHSPMSECGITKDELRQIAKYYGLLNWDKPASPCLSSRIPYNNKITRQKLEQIEKAEDILNSYGFIDVRVRHYGTLAKVEVRKEDLARLLSLQQEIRSKILGLGFEKCEIDSEGLVSGKLNRVLNNKEILSDK
jgi:uncharacterized protein